MSDDGERTCPLCAEEMDLTDQQLKPCHCGYEICIWCWHHVIEMAEKDDTEARCPACRTPYDKDRVLKVAAANSERIIAEVYSEKKQRSHKTKAKISAEVMKHLSGVRVMQKNLVYVTGLPGNLCDESILERKEYFGQYGKVLKVSISRPAGTAPQKTFGAYITYAKEEEAVQCIQAAHNYVLEGKTLRACFGTTKYCRAWLRNLTCSNPDCLYLHDVGSQEDSFTKDETISAYTRSRVPQTTLNNSQRRSGNLLPPPVDDVSINGTGSDKHPVKGSCNVKGSPPNSSLGKFNALPAAASWGLRGLNCRIASNAQCSQTLARQNLETSKSSTLPSSLMKNPIQPPEKLDEVITTSKVPESNVAVAILSPSEQLQLDDWLDSRLSKSLAAVFESDYPLVSAWDDDTIITPKSKEDREDLDCSSIGPDSIKLNTGRQQPTSLSHLLTQVVPETTDASQVSSSCFSSPLVEALEDKESITNLSSGEMMLRNSTMLKCHVRQLSNSDPDVVKHDSAIINGDVHSLVLGSSSVNLYSPTMKQVNIGQHQTLASNLSSVVLTRSRDFNSEPVALSTGESSDWSNEPQGQQLISAMNEMDIPLKEQNLSLHSLNNQDNNTSHLSSTSSWNGLGNKQAPGAESSVDIDTNCSLGEQDSAVVHNGPQIVDVCINSLSRNDSGSSEFNCIKESVEPLDRSATTNTVKDAFVDKTGESSIISDILSLDFDPWDESVSPANSLAKLLGETKKQDGSFSLSSSSRSTTNNQSRFSFARQENQSSLLETPIGESNYVQKFCSSSQNSYQDSFYSDFQVNDYAGPSIDQNFDDSNRSGVSRAKIAVPPGFSAPSRAPPPGFTSQTRFNQTYDGAYSGENHYQSHLVSHSGDVEFIDPAILAVGKSRITVEPNNSTLGLKSSFPAQFVTSDNDPRFHLLSQQMISSHQNMRIPDMEETFWPLNDAFAASRLLAQSHTRFSPLAQLSHQQPRNSLYSSHWDSWNNLHAVADMGMGEVFRNERIGLNDYYKSTPENKFHMPSASDLYSRAFGM